MTFREYCFNLPCFLGRMRCKFHAKSKFPHLATDIMLVGVYYYSVCLFIPGANHLDWVCCPRWCPYPSTSVCMDRSVHFTSQLCHQPNPLHHLYHWLWEVSVLFMIFHNYVFKGSLHENWFFSSAWIFFNIVVLEIFERVSYKCLLWLPWYVYNDCARYHAISTHVVCLFGFYSIKSWMTCYVPHDAFHWTTYQSIGIYLLPEKRIKRRVTSHLPVLPLSHLGPTWPQCNTPTHLRSPAVPPMAKIMRLLITFDKCKPCRLWMICPVGIPFSYLDSAGSFYNIWRLRHCQFICSM